MSGEARGTLLVVAAVAVLAAVGYHGLTSQSPAAGYDSVAHIDYAAVLDAEGRLPREEESYEFASPPAYHLAVIGLQRLSRSVVGDGEGVPGPGGPAARTGWVLLVVAAAALLLLRRRPASVAGAALASLAVAWAVLDALSLAARVPWSAGPLLSLAASVGFVLVSWRLAREVWPRSPLLAAGAAVVVAAMPLVLRLGVMFHPEMPHALLAVVGVALVVAAWNRGWPASWGIWLGAALGLAAVTRQTAAAVAVALLGTALALAGRRAAPFVVVAAASLALVAGPWWVHQTIEHGTPLKSNLDRPGYLLEGGQPRSFFVSLPLRDLVVHPYRPSFENELLPKLHADLWSDWYGVVHGEFWSEPTPAMELFASTQSVVGFGADGLALAGLLAFGVAGARRIRAGRGSPRDRVLALGLGLTVVTFAAFVVTVTRFPQAEGDPIKPSYMLFLTPAFALAGLAAAEWAWRRGRIWRVALALWAVAAAVSLVGSTLTAF